MSATKNKKSILKCIELFNKCTLEWIDTFYSKKLDWIEFSNPGIPQGRKGDYSAFRTAAEHLLRLFPDRKLIVLRSVAEGDCVVLEQEWNGTLAIGAGNHEAGEISKLRIISFFTLENGLIIKQIDYCAQAN
jgi:predicted SnoaL-like aldol condensation-catalyzing enzyme